MYTPRPPPRVGQIWRRPRIDGSEIDMTVTVVHRHFGKALCVWFGNFIVLDVGRCVFDETTTDEEGNATAIGVEEIPGSWPPKNSVCVYDPLAYVSST